MKAEARKGGGAQRWLVRAAAVLAVVVVALAALLWYPPLRQAGYKVLQPGPFFVADEAEEGRIDLNAASPAELTALPGIGEKRAAAIVEYRERHGPFAKVDDLLLVPGIGPKILQGLAELVTC